MTSLINRCLVLSIVFVLCVLIDLCFACLTLNDYIWFSRLPQSNILQLLHVDGHPFPCINWRYFHLRWWPPHMSVFLPGIGGSFHQKASVFFLTALCNNPDMGVSLNGGIPKSPPKWSFVVGKPMVVGETHHFRVHPHIQLSAGMCYQVLCLAVAVAYAVLIMVQLPGGEVFF